MHEFSESPVLIFASGQRCGSTLLQRFLSSHPDITIWGEHDGVLTQFMANFDRLYDWQQLFAHQFEVFMDDGYNNFVPNMTPPATYFAQAHKNLIRDLWQVPAMKSAVTSGALKRFFMVHRWHYAFTSFSRHAYHSPGPQPI
jgi:hypothetical protein